MANVTVVRTASSSQLGSLLTQASASVIYLTQSSASTTYLTQASASTTYLTRASASTTYLTQASASTTYLPQASASSTYLTQASASTNYLTRASASTTYLTQASASTTYLPQASASSTYLTQASASSTYLPQVSASSTYLTQASASSTYLTQASASSTYAPIVPTAQTGFRNLIINGEMDIWQRGAPTTASPTAIGASTVYTADRWNVYRAGLASGASWSQSTDTATIPANFRYALRVQRIASDISTAAIAFTQHIETANAWALRGRTVSLSFYARAGANYSAASNALTVQLVTGTGIDESVRNGMTNQTNALNSTATLTTSWQRFTYTATISSTMSSLSILLLQTPVGTAGANDWFEVTGLQLELGSTATPFEYRHVGIELELCRRYYHRLNGNGSTSLIGTGYAFSATGINAPVLAVNSLRTQASSIDSSGFSVSRFASAGTLYNTGTTVLTSTLQAIGIPTITYTHGSSVFTIGEGIVLSLSSSGYIGFSAEL